MSATDGVVPSWRSALALLGFLAITLVVGQGAGYVTVPAVRDWYPTLAKPAWTPPDWLFPLAWTVLYVLMAIAVWLVWRRPADTSWRDRAIGLWWLQLGLNLAWSFLFFGQRAPLLGLIDVLLLWLAILATIAVFNRVERVAAWLMAPYLLWVSYATAVNAAIVGMN